MKPILTRVVDYEVEELLNKRKQHLVRTAFTRSLKDFDKKAGRRLGFSSTGADLQAGGLQALHRSAVGLV